MRSILLLALAGGLLSACSEPAANAAAPERGRAEAPATTVKLSDEQMVEACAAATAANAREDVKVEASRRNAPESVHLVFAKRADGSQWTVQCRLDGEAQLVWHVVDVEGARDAQVAEGAAAVMRYQLAGETVQVTPAG